MRWKKKGLLWAATGRKNWSVSHAVAPCLYFLQDDIARIYFTTRDTSNRSYVSWIEVELDHHLWRIRSEAKNPIVKPGAPGAFDSSGAMSSWIAKADHNVYFYYTGWNLGVEVPFRLSIGLAVSKNDGKSFKKISEGPLLDRNVVDAYMVASPCVFVHNDLWKMWYVSGLKWAINPDGIKHYYHIRYSYSEDGIEWIRDGTVCIDFANEMEYAIARPSVLWDKGLYRMWYCYRGSSVSSKYRIGYAESKDGISWTRKDDEVGIDTSDAGWDSEMICYPFVFQHDGVTYMLYNGNGYGKTGFGYAVLNR